MSIKIRLLATMVSGLLMGLLPTNADTKVGTPDGNFSVSPTGGAVYSINIDCPKGTGGMEPHLQLAYNSQSGYGLAGYGVTINGLSAITRGPRDLYHDNYTKGILYDNSDPLYLDGKRLICDYTYYDGGTVFTVEGDPFTTVTAHGTYSRTAATLWFEVKSSDGMTYRYGETDDSRLSYTDKDGKPRIHSWYICSAEDASTNTITYSYLKTDNFVRPGTVSYGGNKTEGTAGGCTVHFVYESLGAEAQPFVFDGQKGQIAVRLKTITTAFASNIYRTYDLTYSTSLDGSDRKFARLTSVTEKNSAGESMNPITFSWDGLPATGIVRQDLDVPLDDQASLITKYNMQLSSADINNDGVSDIFRFSDIKDNYTYVSQSCLYISRSKVDLNGAVSYEEPISCLFPTRTENFNYAPLLALDFDGDGFNDLLVPQFVKGEKSKGIRLFMLWGRDLSKGNVKREHFERLLSASNDFPLMATFDINGDGKDELVLLEKNRIDGYYPLRIISSESRNNATADLTFSAMLPGIPQKLFSGDFNGDGLTDIIIFHNNGYKIYYNSGSGIANQNFYEWASTTGTDLKNAWRMEQGDFNGDGLTDFLYAKQDDKQLYYALNNGDGTFASSVATTLPACEISKTGKDDDSFTILVHDIDHDGKSDALVLKSEYSHHHDLVSSYYRYSKTYVRWYISSGEGLCLIKGLETDRREDACNYNATLGDYDGDGHAELLHLGNNLWGTNTIDNTKLHIYKAGCAQPSPGRVNSVSDGLGRTTAIGYQLLTNPSVYHKVGDLAYPVVERLYPLAVVSSTTMSDGAADAKTTKRAYSGLKTHVAGRGLMGFSGTTAACSMLGTEEITTVSQWDNTKYIPTAITTKDTQGDGTATTETTLTKAAVGNNYFTYPSAVISTDADGNVCTTTSTYDTAKGVLLTQKVSHDGGATYRQTTYSDYDKKGGRWQPQTVITVQKHPDDTSTYTAKQTYTYDDRGMPLAATSFAGTDMALTETYTYDTFGNRLSAVASGADVTPVKKIFTYDANGRYITSECTQPATETTCYYYDIMGNLVKEVVSRASSLVTTFTYDSWGTLLTSTSPTGITTTYSEGWGKSPSKRYWRMEQTLGQPWRKTWYDQCGREVLAESVGPDGMSVTTATTYNSHGKPALVSNTMGLLTSSETFAYDSRDRLTSAVASSGRTVGYAYAGRSVTTTENGHVRTRTTDAWGNVLTSADSLGSVAYTYYSSGLPHTATCGDATVTMTYDAAGHRTAIDDPDAGQTTSTWSADGRLLLQTDARGVETTYEYNDLGLVTAQHIGSQTFTSTYGSSAGSKTLPSTMSMGGNTIQYGYDSKDRMISQKRTFADGTTLSFAYGYNANGQPVHIVFPGGLTVGYEYDAYGYCISMTADGQEVYRLLSSDGLRDSTTFCDALWHVTQHDALGYLKREKWGHNDINLTTRTYAFDGPTGNLTSRHLPSRTYIYPGSSIVNIENVGNALQDIGSILPIRDSLKFNPDVPLLMDGYEEFAYDGLDRLTRVSPNKNQSIMTIKYGPDGNILSKTGVGDYSYDAAIRPHAVIGVTNQKGLIPSVALETTYGDLNKISVISDGTLTTTFDYGPDQERWLTVEKKNDTDYLTTHYAPGVERITLGGVSRTFFYLGHGVIVMQQGSTYVPLLTVTDHQGTIAGLVDAKGTWQFDANYDAWGLQTVAKNSIGFRRGYTGHEMLPEYGLINMNGRLYDPLLGRFLSPDNYVQQPDNSQSFNRYSYCLNNPLKYTDPDGEFIFSILSSLFAPQLLPAAINLDWGWINGGFKALKNGQSFFQGSLRGLVNSAIDCFFLHWGGSGMPFWKNVSLGALEGGVSGLISSAIWGENLVSGMKSSALHGAVFSAVTSDEMSNFLRGKGFKSNNSVLDDFRLGKYSSDYLNWHQDALDYFGFEGEFVIRNPLFENNNDPAITTFPDGKIFYNYNAFTSYDRLHFVADHEARHKRDILDGITDFDASKSLYELNTYIYNYKRQGYYPKHSLDLSNRINYYATLSSENGIISVDEMTKYIDIYKYKKPFWHFLYKLNRRW